MPFNVSSLTDYVNEQSQDLITATTFTGETAALANVQTGVKSETALQLLSVDPIPQDGEGCGFNASGDTTITQRKISAKAYKFQDALCLRALQAKWTQILLKAGQNYDENDVPKAIVDLVLAKIKERLEKMDWQGDTASVSAYLNRYDGLRKIIKNATGTTTATASTWNATNARTIIKSIIAAIPAALKGNPNVKVYMGYDAAETYRQALMDANLYHVAAGSGTQKGIMAEGSVHEIVPLHGLDGLTTSTGDNPFIFAMDFDKNVFMGVDMENEEEEIKMWYSSDDDNVKYSVRGRRGWQVAYPSEIVEYSNS